MNTKIALTILGVAVLIIAIVAIARPKSDTADEPKIDPVTGEVILGTGGPDDGTGEGVVPADSKDPNAPANPTFPKTGFKPVK